ncbi:MAG: bifunctional proline dehydrogenase/L-glutamate gamma-semialdehyde dehydrogenase [Tannerella sp.]|jgi:RHH-type proline utilization regulon transcriptional repressor/proline dehydrogenase/delta 1-pyrroline-5-carboxylate dehydrogenase|nr:bifunctional proline dehydrogenase/L-glutamate gamma-semialdehyde dehydrogenase [Tannerella sp.]
MENVTVKDVLYWARQFLAKADEELTQDEIKEQKKYASLVQTPEYKTFLSQMLDESSQIRDSRKLNKRVRRIIEKYGIPDFFSASERFLLRLYMMGGYLFPTVAMPVFKKKLRAETTKIIIAGERPKLTRHLAERRESNIGQNVNLLGEVVLGDAEARNRYEHYLEALTEPDIHYISIKISGIYARIHPLSYERNKAELCEMVAAIYRKAMTCPYTDNEGHTRAKFVNLDMEEYKDAHLTMDVFLEVLGRHEFKDYSAGIVIQAYLPDAEGLQKRLLDFARKRVADGGAPLKMRLVKGANLQMESIVSSLRGWENPVFRSKVEVDANYMHILDIALQPANVKACHVGIASHNYFTIAYAHLLAEKNGVSGYVTFEMLEGMANNLPRVMRKLQKQIILYTPVVKANHFLNAISYLVRRLDENTGKDNFLCYTFNLKLDSPHWNFLAAQFQEAYKLKNSVCATPFRTQDRTKAPVPVTDIDTFTNEPDTDLDLPQNRKWALDILSTWQNAVNEPNIVIPVQIGDSEIYTDRKRVYYDRSRNMTVSFYEANLSSREQVAAIIDIAEKDASGWRQTSVDKRNEILHRAADNLSARRGDLIGCMAAVTGKTFMDGDVEVSEAIDFCRYYPITMKAFDKLPAVSHRPKGIILVISPWNFPLAIPAGGVASALAGGNTVILKPATVALPVAWKFAECFWNAGVPRDTLQVVCPAERDSLACLTAHPSVKHVILTGGTDTAFRLLKDNPKTPLSAETGGKNVIIVTAAADLDHAILNIVTSAFGNAGQKCSACSLLLLDKRAYHDDVFKAKLKDAVTSMRTGSVWDTMTAVGPMIDNKNEKLLHAVEHLEPGESWLVAPEFVDEKKYILKPTVKWGVKPSGYTFKNELFAPLLSVVCIDDLKQGIEYANSSEYCLTAGLQSLNEDERRMWRDRTEAGNLYINRGITGAIVSRQPFGGMKRSAFGGGIKAGGPNYVSCFVELTENKLPETSAGSPFSEFEDEEKDGNRLNYAVESLTKAWLDEFSQEKDISHIYGEENIFRYLPLESVGFRVEEKDSMTDILIVLFAAGIAGTPLTISVSADNPKIRAITSAVAKLKEIRTQKQTGTHTQMPPDMPPPAQPVNVRVQTQVSIQTVYAFIEEMDTYERVRTCSPDLPDAFYRKAAELGKHIAHNKPLAEGRIELLHYLKEQSIAYEYHRYGSVFGGEK